MKLQRLKTTKLDAHVIPDESLLSAINKSDEPVFAISQKDTNPTDPLVTLEISFRKCVRVGALRK